MTASFDTLALAERFARASTLDAFIDTAVEHAALWRAVANRSHHTPVPTDLSARAERIGAPRHLLVLLEDWCGDALNSVPVIDAFVSTIPGFTLRVLSRDANDDLMQAHLSPSGTRAIPVVIVYDEAFRELGWWGSRPRALQAWTDSDEAHALDKAEQYAFKRRWYVRDRGASTLAEIVTLLEETASG
jgi:hypothetical protein